MDCTELVPRDHFAYGIAARGARITIFLFEELICVCAGSGCVRMGAILTVPPPCALITRASAHPICA